jgi:recombinase
MITQDEQGSTQKSASCCIQKQSGLPLLDILDRPIAFHRIFADLTGSVQAGLMLSQAFYWSKRIDKDRNGWFYKAQQEWQEETRLTRYEQEAARERLRQTSFWHEERRGVPARLYFRIDRVALGSEIIKASNDVAHTRMRTQTLEVSDLESSQPLDNNEQYHRNDVAHSSMRDSRNLECGFSAIKNAEFPQSITEITPEITPEREKEREEIPLPPSPAPKEEKEKPGPSILSPSLRSGEVVVGDSLGRGLPGEKKRIPYDEEKTWNRIFELYAQGFGAHRAAKQLTEEGWDTPAGNVQWNPQSLKKMWQREGRHARYKQFLAE